MKVDLHVHTSNRSPCGESTEDEMIQAAISRGMDGLAFTDHGRLIPPAQLAVLRSFYAPFYVYSGIEIRFGNEDVLVLGLSDTELETERWTYPKLHRFVRRRGGFLVLAHPYRYSDTITIDVESYPPDAVELASIHIVKENRGRIRRLARRLGLSLMFNSDAHKADDVGTYYNVLPYAPQSDHDLVDVLQSGYSEWR